MILHRAAISNCPGYRCGAISRDLRTGVIGNSLGDIERGAEQHPEKTFVGRLERGFDFPGYDFSASADISASRRSVQRLAEKIAQLYEQGAGKPRLERYTENWLRWLNGGVSVPAD